MPSNKQNLRDGATLYTSEAIEYQRLQNLERPWTTSGTLNFTSTSSSQTYNSTTGEQGLATLLEVPLSTRIGTASDLNEIGDISTLTTTADTDLVVAVNEVKGETTSLLGRGDVISVTATRTLALTDANNYLRVTGTGTINITVPPQSSVAWADNTEIAITQTTTGTASLVAGSGVTINSRDSLLSIDGQWNSVALKRVAENEWDLVGALA